MASCLFESRDGVGLPSVSLLAWLSGCCRPLLLLSPTQKGSRTRINPAWAPVAWPRKLIPRPRLPSRRYHVPTLPVSPTSPVAASLAVAAAAPPRGVEGNIGGAGAGGGPPANPKPASPRGRGGGECEQRAECEWALDPSSASGRCEHA